MKVLVISEEGRWLGVAKRMQQEGHVVTFVTVFPSNIGKGIVDVITPAFPLVKSDGSVHAANIDRLLKKFTPELIILDGKYYVGAIQTCLKDIPTYGAGPISHVVSNIPKYFEVLRKRLDLNLDEFGGIWNGQDFVACFHWLDEGNFIGKNSGVNVDAAGAGKMSNDKERLKKLVPFLNQHFYRGGIIVSKNRLLLTTPLSFFECYIGSISSFLFSVATMGKVTGKILHDQVFGQNLVSIPPFPFVNDHNVVLCEGFSFKLDKGSEKHFWIEDVRSEGGTFYCTSQTGRLGYATSRGDTVQEMSRRIYRTINQNYPKDAVLQFRTDLGARASSVFE